MIKPLRFTLADVERANESWGANCGPTALAAICGLTLDEVRPHMGDFESKRYTNPTLMFAALGSIGARWKRRGVPNDSNSLWLDWGLYRIQWTGPWMNPEVPVRARYRYTHWIGSAKRGTAVGVWDVNAMANSTGWCALADWERVVVPWITAEIKRADGGWCVTHAIEVQP